MIFRSIFSCLLLLLFLSNCDKTESETKLRNGKAILQVRIAGVSAIVKIDTVKKQVNVYLPSHTPNINNLSLIVETSPGSSIAAGYTDFSAPRTYTLKAEDGSTQDYTVVVSQVKFANRLNNILPADLLNVHPDYCTQAFPGFLRVNLGCGPTAPTGEYRTTCLFDFRNKSTGADLTGTYALGQASSFPANVIVAIATNGNSSLSLRDKPNFGTLKVTSYNPTLKLITGSLQLQYNVFNNPTGEYYTVYGDFYNVPL